MSDLFQAGFVPGLGEIACIGFAAGFGLASGVAFAAIIFDLKHCVIVRREKKGES